MANRNKFEEMLERLINEDHEGAEELFHEIVVEKSRDIYESLLEDDLADEEVDESEHEDDDEDLDESEDDDEDLDENFDLDEFEVEADPMSMDMGSIGGDPTDDMMGDIETDGGDMDMDMDMEGDDEEVEDRLEDLEDALDELKAEFEKMMSGDESDDDMDMDDADMDMDDDDMDIDDADMDIDDDDMDDDDMDDDDATPPFAKKDSSKMSATEQMREYVEKVAPAKMGDDGVNNKSSVANKNNMGGTTTNILRTDTEKGVEANKGNLKGSSLSGQNPKDMNTKNVNVPGAKGATKMAPRPGHGAEKKGKPETADKSAQSTLNGVKTRAK